MHIPLCIVIVYVPLFLVYVHARFRTRRSTNNQYSMMYHPPRRCLLSSADRLRCKAIPKLANEQVKQVWLLLEAVVKWTKDRYRPRSFESRQK